ncbi:MAG: hypothetical protein ABJ387_14960 [Balneola sp.]|jgi:thymidylate synthase|uniref:hypothetical protein n=1 Tax=Balneola sp. EhC07 TaxID=1849360 RepID=UPI0007F37C02|nr:hypothetical protein [Balneola sp. EhC07]MBO6572997.1 hypothetical protein [Balneola sp.]MBR9916118.1 hypothetical protein [bacterium]OAN61748.1 hypothetical protein A8B79_04805 [Balneola sp. EhC07]
MPEEIFIIILTAIISGTGFVTYIAKKTFEINKIKAMKDKSSGEINPQFFKALGDFKKSTERRIANLESIVADLEEEKIRIPEASNAGEIEIEEKEVRSSDEKEDDSNLRNMLNE